MKTRCSWSVAALLLLTLLGCGGSNSNYAHSVYGTVGGYSMANAHPKVISLMVARKISLPLYIVLDPQKVKNTWTLDTAPCATGAAGCKHFKLMDVQYFVRHDLKAAMENYFDRVEVVDSSQALPSTPYVVGDVRINNIKLHALVRGPLVYEIIQMTWAFAMRRTYQQDYAYSFAGTATSDDS